jgi:hypothetical protein
MPEVNEEIESTIEDEVVPEEQKSEEEESPKDDFEKDSESVSVGKYNQAIRKQREIELEKRELEKQLAAVKSTKPADEEEDDFFKEEEKEKVDISSLIDEKVKPVLERLNQKEAEDRKNKRTAFFQAHPEYLNAEKWQELLDEMDNSLNPNSKDDYYKQLNKAHSIISAETDYSEIDKKKKEMASEMASKGDGSQKAADKKSSLDDRADRLAQKMPIGYIYTGK